jgi:hypothetical protein
MSEKETILKVNPEQKTEVKLKGLTKLQAKLLRAGKLPLVALAGILGGAVYGRSGSSLNTGMATETDSDSSNADFEVEEIVPETVGTDEIEMEDSELTDGTDDGLVNLTVSSNAQFADAVTDDMNFGEAFDTAREQLGGGGFFMWKGQPYSTYTKEEWDSFSDDQKKEFFEAFKEQSDFENAEEEPTDMDTDIDSEVEPEAEQEETNEDTKETEEISEEETELEPENKAQPEPQTEPEGAEPEAEPEDALPDEEPEEVEPDVEDVEIEDEFVDLDELGTEDEIIEGLNDGEAFEEEDNFGEDFDL